MRGHKYRMTFEFVDTEQEAKERCVYYDSHATSYMRRHHPATYTPWENEARTMRKFIVWYYA